ncbi:MAG: T9SS type A sorting domain-containing protein [Bacteroidales bacterium]|nr:T9SS type A sorting domain-containing protein [Bacteroidales bacterium]
MNINSPAKVSLKVIDINGKIIRYLQWRKEAGQHLIALDMSDVSSGVYYYSLFVNDEFVGSEKMLMVR